MANALSFLADPEYWRSVRETAPNSLGRLAQGMVAGTVGAPVDIANMVLRPIGLGSDNPIGGQNSIARLMNIAPDDTAFNIGAMLPTDPTDLAHGLPVLAGIFAGKGAKTADALMLAKAQDMAKAGMPAPQIWKETGWALDTPDKLPRFEIPDNAAKWQGRASKGYLDETKSRDMLRHESMVENYPDVMNLKMTAHPDDASSAFVNVGQPYINVGLKGADNPASPAIHELQHAIQQREGFARGGSPEQMQKLIDENMKQREKVKYALEQSNLTDDPIARSNWRQEAAFNGARLPNKGIPDNAEDAYSRLAGEAEARLTQARMNLTPEQRLAQYPYDPQYFEQATGVPLNSLIVRQDGGKAMSVPDSSSDYIVGLADEADKAMRAYKARRASSFMPKPESIRLRDMLIGAGAMGGGIAGGYYGMDAMAGER